MVDKVNGVKTPAEKVKDLLSSAGYCRKNLVLHPGDSRELEAALEHLINAVWFIADEVFSDAKSTSVEKPNDRLVVDKDTPSIIVGVGGYSLNEALCTVCDIYAHQFRSSGIRSISFKDDHPNDKVIIALDSGIKLTLVFDYLEYTVEV